MFFVQYFPSVSMLAKFHEIYIFCSIPFLLCQTSSLRNCERECAPITTRNKSTINIVVILNKDVAVKALPVIYLAAQDLRQHGLTGPLQGWDVKIEYIDSEFSSTTASLEAMKLVNGCAAGEIAALGISRIY